MKYYYPFKNALVQKPIPKMCRFIIYSKASIILCISNICVNISVVTRKVINTNHQ